MSSNLMDTVPGGESTQYESINTVTQPHSKEGGQLSSAETTSPSSQPSTNAASRGLKTAENVRFGQSISEGGMGGQTEGMTGESNAQGSNDGEAAKSRVEQGYGQDKDMDRNVGA